MTVRDLKQLLDKADDNLPVVLSVCTHRYGIGCNELADLTAGVIFQAGEPINFCFSVHVKDIGNSILASLAKWQDAAIEPVRESPRSEPT